MGQFSNYPVASKADYADATTFLIQNSNGDTKLASLEDLGANFFCGVKCARLTIASADVLTLDTTPIQIIAAQGAGTVIEVISGFVSIDFNTTAYSTSTDLIVETAGATKPQLEGIGALNCPSSLIPKFTPVDGQDKGSLVINAAVNVSVPTASGNPTAGDSDIEVFVYYRVINI